MRPRPRPWSLVCDRGEAETSGWRGRVETETCKKSVSSQGSCLKHYVTVTVTTICHPSWQSERLMCLLAHGYEGGIASEQVHLTWSHQWYTHTLDCTVLSWLSKHWMKSLSVAAVFTRDFSLSEHYHAQLGEFLGDKMATFSTTSRDPKRSRSSSDIFRCKYIENYLGHK